MYLNNNITGQVCSNRFLLCIDCLENESTSSCRNPYQIQICISYMHNDQYIFYYILSVFIHIEKSLQMDKILWRNFCQSLRKPSRQKFKNLFACEFTAQECRDEYEISVHLTWLDCTTQIWLFNGTKLLLAFANVILIIYCYTALPWFKSSLVYLQ